MQKQEHASISHKASCGIKTANSFEIGSKAAARELLRRHKQSPVPHKRFFEAKQSHAVPNRAQNTNELLAVHKVESRGCQAQSERSAKQRRDRDAGLRPHSLAGRIRVFADVRLEAKSPKEAARLVRPHAAARFLSALSNDFVLITMVSWHAASQDYWGGLLQHVAAWERVSADQPRSAEATLRTAGASRLWTSAYTLIE